MVLRRNGRNVSEIGKIKASSGEGLPSTDEFEPPLSGSLLLHSEANGTLRWPIP